MIKLRGQTLFASTFISTVTARRLHKNSLIKAELEFCCSSMTPFTSDHITCNLVFFFFLYFMNEDNNTVSLCIYFHLHWCKNTQPTYSKFTVLSFMAVVDPLVRHWSDLPPRNVSRQKQSNELNKVYKEAFLILTAETNGFYYTAALEQ